MTSHGGATAARPDATTGARLLVDAIVAAGVEDVVIAPGSRSTPLVAACVSDGRVRCRVVHDERSGAFVALGLARGGRPAALLVTSGTAVANALPAVVEADVDHVPLLILSADRPPEATGTDANQTIEQRFFFAGRVRAFVDVPPPEDQPDPDACADAVFDAVACATSTPRGPVHVNARYRKPLEPTSAQSSRPARLRRRVFADAGVNDATARAFVDAIDGTTDAGVVVAGAARDDDDAAGIAALVRALGWPVLACATSGLRAPGLRAPGAGPGGLLVRCAPLLLPAVALPATGPALPALDVVVRVGGSVVDDGLAALCARARRVVRVDDDRRRRLERAAATTLVPVAPGPLGAALPRVGWAPSTTTHTWRALAGRDEAACAALRRVDGAVHGDIDGGGLDEPRVARRVADAALSSGARLFVGNSVSIRAVDRFCPIVPRVIANRGASGIDGLVSTAAGLAAAAGPTLALIGDVSFLHDAGALSSLGPWGRAGLPLRVVVVDNRGGQLFRHLPIARHPGLLSPYFTTPHDVDVVALCRAYGVPAVHVDDEAGLRARLAAPYDGLDVVVVAVDGDDSVAAHRRWTDAVAAAVDPTAGEAR
jgi:2-succinyl-5-enolpyruvyl-6-hydroxy-3-cyclohexene-1-carboxylate synthase